MLFSMRLHSPPDKGSFDQLRRLKAKLYDFSCMKSCIKPTKRNESTLREGEGSGNGLCVEVGRENSKSGQGR